jgi:hypothetical protein
MMKVQIPASRWDKIITLRTVGPITLGEGSRYHKAPEAARFGYKAGISYIGSARPLPSQLRAE